MNTVDTPARNTSKQSQFEAGKTMAAPGTDTDAGGANLAKPYTSHTQSGGTALNKGRLKPGTEVHYGTKPASIKQGSTTPSR
jgi:hypothetical protein